MKNKIDFLYLSITIFWSHEEKKFKDGPSQTSTTLVIIIDRTERAL